MITIKIQFKAAVFISLIETGKAAQVSGSKCVLNAKIRLWDWQKSAQLDTKERSMINAIFFYLTSTSQRPIFIPSLYFFALVTTTLVQMPPNRNPSPKKKQRKQKMKTLITTTRKKKAVPTPPPPPTTKRIQNLPNPWPDPHFPSMSCLTRILILEHEGHSESGLSTSADTGCSKIWRLGKFSRLNLKSRRCRYYYSDYYYYWLQEMFSVLNYEHLSLNTYVFDSS